VTSTSSSPRRRWAQARRRWPVAVGLALLATTGCAGATSDDAARAADAFVADRREDPARACGLLAPPTRANLVDEQGGPCAEALAAMALPSAGRRVGVEVAGHTARVRYASDTLFLALFDDGWKVLAAGCERRSDDDAVPYDCDVEGG
jgi:hypothetical protein